MNRKQDKRNLNTKVELWHWRPLCCHQDPGGGRAHAGNAGPVGRGSAYY